ncbi:MAG: fibronectin type III domain-containing protein [Deltaproteobacteria bacterium]|nr:fibronectin type III domain-containing protein [Deltaproteobacteria bacterium]
MTPPKSRRAPLFLMFTTLAALAGCDEATPEVGADFEAEATGDPAEEVNEAGTGAAQVRANNVRSRSAGADTSRPIIQGLNFGDQDGWVRHNTVQVVVDAKDDVDVEQVCITWLRSCRDWVDFDPEGVDFLLPRGMGPHTVRVWARDAAGNISAMARGSVGIDARPPVDGTVSATPIAGGLRLDFSGFSDRESGVVGYRVVGRQDGAAPRCSVMSAIYWEGVEAGVTLNGLQAGDHALRVCAVDALGRMSQGTTLNAGPRAESDAPQVTSVVIDGGAEWVSDREVDVQVEVEDASSVERMCFSEGRSCSAWQDFRAETTVRLSAGTGMKTVYAWFEDAFGNVSEPVGVDVGLDLSPPTDGTLSLSHAPSGVVLAWPGAADPHSGIAEYSVRMAVDSAPSDCRSGAEIYRGPDTTFTQTGLTSAQRYGFRVCAIDTSGWTSTGLTGTITPLAEYDSPVATRFVINDDMVETYDRYVELSLSATDATGIARMCVSNTPTCSTWLAYQTTFNHTLATGDEGTRTVYLWLEDSLGNRSATPFTDQIDFLAD